MSNEAKAFTISEAKQKEIDNLIRAEIKKKFGHVVAVEAALDHRYTNREANAEKKIAGWGGYQRFVLENSHTVYVGLTNPNDPQVSISEQPRPSVLNKVRSKAKKAEERAQRVADRKAKAAAPKQAKAPKADKTAKDGVAYNKTDAPEPKQKGWKPAADDVTRLMKVTKCGHSTAVKQLQNLHAIELADAAAKA